MQHRLLYSNLTAQTGSCCQVSKNCDAFYLFYFDLTLIFEYNGNKPEQQAVFKPPFAVV